MQQTTHQNPDELNGAVEVVTMLGDSVVDVHHLQPNRDPNAKRTTLMMFAVGALFLLMSLIAFSKGVSTAATNKRNLQRWTKVKEHSARSFRGQALGVAWDYMAFGGLALGIFCIGWGLMRARREDPPAEFTVDGEATPLVAEHAGHMVMSVPAAMDAELRTSAGITGKSELGQSFVVPGEGSVRLSNGTADYIVRRVPAPKQSLRTGASFNSRTATFLAGSAIAHALLLVLMNTVQPDAKGLATDLGTQDVRLTISETSPPDVDPPTPDKPDDSDLTAADGANNGKAGEPGAAGNPDTPSPKGATAVKGHSETVKVSKRDEIAAAREAGVLGVFHTSQSLSDIDGDAWLNEGMDDENYYGHDAETGNGTGHFGQARQGFGPGGDGNDGVIRSGRYHTYGPGNSDVHINTTRRIPGMDHDPTGPVAKIGTAESEGGLDKSIIRRYIQRKLRTIRNCYERQLLVRPDLAGTVIAKFIIMGNGNVINSRAVGMNHPGLQSCVASVIANIHFPKTSDGGIVKVNKYPFRFSSR